MIELAAIAVMILSGISLGAIALYRGRKIRRLQAQLAEEGP